MIDLESAVRQSDIVSCVTTSTAPIVKGQWLRPGTHVDLAGAFKPTMRETDAEVVARASVYVDTRDGQPFAAVAEVVNTFREMKLYAIESLDTEGLWHRRVAKDFYVSPLSDPGMQFDFKLGTPREKWRVNIDTHDASERVLLSSIRGEQRELSSARLVWYAFKYPMLSLKIIGLIHWHALLLWIRRVPFFRKTERLEAQQDVMRPHSSLKPKTP